MDRYIKNMNMLSKDENNALKNFKVCVIGCGGLGGYIIEYLGRLGIGYITAVDSDVFDESNLNRQILSDETVLGKSKSIIAKERMKKVNSNITINAVCDLYNENNGKDIIKDHDIVVDAVDNIHARFLIQQHCNELNIPFVHGAIAGWYGQVCTVFPKDNIFDIIYNDKTSKGAEEELGNPSFTPGLVAALEVSEVLKVLLKRGDLLRNKILTINLLDNEYDIIELK